MTMPEMTPEEKADWQLMAENPYVMVLTNEAFAELEAALDREPRVLPELERLLKQRQDFWAESPVISSTEAP